MEFVCDSKYYVLPVGYRARNKRLYFYINGELVYDLVVALEPYEPDCRFYINLERFRGMTIKLVSDPQVEFPIEKADAMPEGEEAYNGKYRPLAHFTSKRGWLNDPNGLVYYKGKYLMFYQHNPVACTWENMHWGYAVSDDFMHWKEKDIVLFPDREGTMFSGSAVIDVRNVTGLKENENDVILLFYTCAGSTSETAADKPFTQCLAYSTDGGETFVKYEKNPLIPQLAPGNRDPKVIYHEESKRYVMVLYLDNNEYAFFFSENLLDWVMGQKLVIPGEIECPDFYPLPVDGDPEKRKWVLIGASDKYFIGDFDGNEFVPMQKEPLTLKYGNCSYAAQSWSDLPDSRRIRITSYCYDPIGMPFGSCMSIPAEMSLNTMNGGIRLCTNPVREISQLYSVVKDRKDFLLEENGRYCEKLDGKCYDISLTVRLQENAVFSWSLFGLQLKYFAGEGILRCRDQEAPAPICNGRLELRIVIDTVCAEIFADSGSVYMGMHYVQDRSLNCMELEAEVGDAEVTGLKTAELNAFWLSERQESL